MRIRPVDRQRRHTLHFLAEARATAAVFLDTEIDMTRVCEHRAGAHAEGRHYSVVSYVLHTAARVLAAHPEANAAVRGGLPPKVAGYESVDGKLTLDKTLGGRRVVLSAVLPGLDRADLDEVQRQVEHYRDGDVDRMPEFDGVRLLQRLPWLLARIAYRGAVRPLRRRASRLGTFAVTSLGHRPVDGFYSVGGTTITLGLGRIMDRPVVRGTTVVVAPVMRLSLTFDHRVIDGAEAADVLADLKDRLECFSGDRALAGVRDE
ncbi:2-oxo acid dehydrogenase subunit E2 [Kutzneria kofuensis]|uniref:Pyruvate/2-oxoglutarate dehydrogenase complex dihydrolipoamide acyltransferase (E2) component n=1 Tax=Kutzneria kofuensis TaxID=103725 RepID=A0A7W9KQB2_9PSEU|nr:2-oxo acid dehydrogenase subunit E2 [Kutzneria kofuensis]MBB5896761.1 pyruvate/2-oxoglutarate dehydrogenase complex dihydrolipoamide acyltransferase (E2) component [Kutzneria kofuensis]